MLTLGHYQSMASSKPSAPAESPAEPTRTPGNRFFSWMRDLGIQRQPGWVGGVSAGLGFRLGIDPLIVRGIIVVVAVLGGPALLLYAAAWLLLPDTDDRIHAEELGKGRFETAIIGIGVMLLLSMLPLNQGFWYAGAAYWGDISLGASIGRVLWTAILLTAIVFFVIWIARRANGSTPTVMPATTDDKPDTVPTAPTEQLANEAVGTASNAAPTPPPAPAPDAPADELQAWKEQQALWKQQHTEWKAQQAATERELRHQRAMEAHERALAASAERAERRRVARLANPRINAATVAVSLGVAILAGGISALLAGGNPDVAGHEATIALATATIVLGLSIVVAGALRHRSGVLTFFAILAILGLLVSASIPRDRQLVATNSGWGVGGDARLASPLGSLNLWVHEESPGGITDVWQGAGSAQLHVMKGASVRLELISKSGSIAVYDQNGAGYGFAEGIDGVRRVGDESRWTTVLGPDPTPSKTLRLWQGSGSIVIFDDNLSIAQEDDSTEEGTQ